MNIRLTPILFPKSLKKIIFLPVLGFILVLTGLLTNCSGKREYKKPDNLIEVDKMKDILYDIYLAEAYSNYGNFSTPYRDYFALLKYRESEKLIFKKYKIDKKRFESSMEYYLYHYDQLPSLYDDLYNRLDQAKKKVMQDSIAYRKKDSILHPEKRIRALHIQDSILKATQKAAREMKRRDSLRGLHPTKSNRRKPLKEDILFNQPQTQFKSPIYYALSH